MTSKPRNYPQVRHHGAVTGVTGSCHRYLASEQNHLLIDCGLFQGRDARLKAMWVGQSLGDNTVDDAVDPVQIIEFELQSVRALVVTHVHIDHIGRLPYLIAAGFDGPIYCSKPTAHLLPLVIEDALKVGFTRNERLISQFLARVYSQLVALDYGVWESLDHLLCSTDTTEAGSEQITTRLSLRLQPAGHILGSAYVELHQSAFPQPGCRASALSQSKLTQSKLPQSELSPSEQPHGNVAWQHRTVFSGDLGADHAPLLPPPIPPVWCNTLVIESTYGDRQHEDREHRIQRLQAVLDKALANGGTVMIPAFSIGRTQELLYELEALINARNDPAITDLQIIVDSPLAARFTESYRALKRYWDAEARERVTQGRHPLSFDNLYTIDSHEEHMQTVDYLSRNRQPAVVLAASGMASGGRIVNYLKAMLADPVHDVLFVGYQAAGTPGRALQDLAQKQQRREFAPGGSGDNCSQHTAVPSIELDGQRIEVRAAIHTLGGYSAHADLSDLLRFAESIDGLEEVRIVHGDDEAKQSFQLKLTKKLAVKGELGVKVWIPGLDE
ncbi:MAG: MBL fold metallo-hydrolase [Pseudohongiella nitratireducens]|nr:MBL fold metallo-hydrolase [Pseudohongiella nitratireducens]MDF1622621.1 MBL fold metallo-hydrolase [Pseudohongiella nitratireducens]